MIFDDFDVFDELIIYYNSYYPKYKYYNNIKIQKKIVFKK